MNPIQSTTPPGPATLLKVSSLRKHYTVPKRWLAPARPPILAVDDVSFAAATCRSSSRTRTPR